MFAVTLELGHPHARTPAGFEFELDVDVDVDTTFETSISILDTLEMRWFADGPLPADMKAWFTRGRTIGLGEQRWDTYLLGGPGSVGIKRRFQQKLELKVRNHFGEVIELRPELVGRLETWRRWSPADTLVDTDAHGPWLDVRKRIVKRRFNVDGEEIEFSPGVHTMVGSGCDVEIAEVEVHDQTFWSFAFAAFGPEQRRFHALQAACQTLAADCVCPAPIQPGFGQSIGYPEWLNTLDR